MTLPLPNTRRYQVRSISRQEGAIGAFETMLSEVVVEPVATRFEMAERLIGALRDQCELETNNLVGWEPAHDAGPEQEGWSNRDTWLVALTIDNDASANLMRQAATRLVSDDMLTGTCRALVAMLTQPAYLPALKPLQLVDWRFVNWDELATHWAASDAEAAEAAGWTKPAPDPARFQILMTYRSPGGTTARLPVATGEGEPIEFDTREAAQAKADRWAASVQSTTFEVVELAPNGKPYGDVAFG